MNKNLKVWNHFYWHVLLLGSLIFSHPLFKALNGQSEFLLAHNLEGPNLLYWIIAVGFFVPLLLVLVVYLLTKVLTPIRDQVKIVSLFIFAGLFLFIHVNHWMESHLSFSVLISALLALVFVRLYTRSIYVRTLLSYATFLVVITPALFSFSPNVRQILLPQQVADDLNTANSLDRNPVVILLLDELPVLSLLDDEGNINAERFPNLAEFSSQSSWYKYATTVAEATLNAVPPILTGQINEPHNKKLPLASNYPDNLFTLLSNTHKINAFETFTHICPTSLCKSSKPDWRLITEDTAVIFAHMTAPDRVKQNLPQIDNKWVGYLRDKDERKNIHTDRDLHPHHRYKVRVEKLGWFLSELESIESTSLNYLHMLIPHSPWMYLPDGRIYSYGEQRSFTGTLPAGTRGLTHKKQLYAEQHLMDYVQQRHLLQTGYADKLLGDVFTALKQRNMFEDALIVVMSDHGVSFKPGESLREAVERNSQDILSVLLMIKYPGQKQAVTDLQAARTIDVLPTILDSLNNKDDRLVFDGRSLLQPRETELTTLELQRDTGEIQQFRFNDFKDDFEQTVHSRKKVLTNGDFDAIYALNGANLVNQTVQQFASGGTLNYSLRLDNPQLYNSIDLTQSSIPTLIRSNRSVQSDESGKVTVAVSVNGVIRGVSFLQQIETVESDFQVLVSPESFQDGVNSISFYRVDKVGEEISLSLIPLERNTQAELVRDSDTDLSLLLDSLKLTVNSQGKSGEITIFSDEKDSRLRLTGWSASSEDGRVAAEIFFFSDEVLIASVKPHLSYPRAQEYTGFENAEYSGFSLSMPIKAPSDLNRKAFTAIAIFDTGMGPVANELRYANSATGLFKTRKIKTYDDTLKQVKDKTVIKHGKIYDFSDDTQALLFSGEGWSNTKSNSRWNVSENATLNFKVQDDKFPLELILQSSPFFVKGKHETQKIKASFLSGNNQLISLQHGVTDGRFVIHIKASDIAADGAVSVSLEFLNAASPQSLDVNNDTRLLAIKVKTIQVLIAKSDPE